MERDWSRQGKSALFHLVHPDGYVSYRIGRESGPVGHRNTCAIVDYAWCTPEAHAGLWQVLLGLDLCATIESARIPLDDPLPYLLTDPRQVRTAALTDGLWVRPLDVPALLAARSYAVDVDLVLRVRDDLLGDTAVRLRGGRSGAECAADQGRPDVDLDVATLGAVVLGGTRLVTAARGGRVSGDPAAIVLLDHALQADVEPQFGTYF
jgi:predicted acetyltransferase